MIPPLVLEPKDNEIILDMCAAPGSKTTQLAEMMKNKGIIIANDNSLKRLKALRINLQRAGISDCAVNYMDGRNLWKTGLKFDKVSLDAPCSGSGTIISSYRVLKMWSPFIVKKMSRLQKQLITSASKCLKGNGSVVYSTCSLDPEENEGVIDFAVRELGLRVEKIEINNLNYHKGIIEWNGKKFSKEIENCVRIHPFDNNTEGFFICKLRF
jgi:NOL1/NOP2/sun family putative RNA methylase